MVKYASMVLCRILQQYESNIFRSENYWGAKRWYMKNNWHKVWATADLEPCLPSVLYAVHQAVIACSLSMRYVCWLVLAITPSSMPSVQG